MIIMKGIWLLLVVVCFGVSVMVEVGVMLDVVKCKGYV